MRFNVIFKQKNPDYNNEYAKQYHLGKESENNRKDLWSSTYGLNDEVTEYSITENGNYNLNSTMTSGDKIDESIPNIQIIKCFDKKNNEIGTFGVSLNLIDKTHKAFDKKRNITRYYFYLKPNEEFVELRNGLFVNKDDIPEKLIRQ